MHRELFLPVNHLVIVKQINEYVTLNFSIDSQHSRGVIR